MFRRFAIFQLFAACTLMTMGAPVLAQNAQRACAPDIRAYCAGVQQGEGRIAQCLRSHQQQLSPACQQGMAKASALMKEVVQACEDDLHKFCAGAAPGTVKDCLRANFRELSLPCKRDLFEAKRGM